MRQVRSLWNTCSTVTPIAGESGSSRKEHQKKKKTYKERDDKFHGKRIDNQLYNILKKTILPFQIDKVLKKSLHMFDIQKTESMNNVIAYVAPKNKTMAHVMNLNNWISCVVGISIFRFKTYKKQVFDLMQIQTSSAFEQFLQFKPLNANKNKS